MKKRIFSSIALMMLVIPPIIFGDPSILGNGSTGSYIGRYFFASIMLLLSFYAIGEANKAMLSNKLDKKGIKYTSFFIQIVGSAIPFAAVFLTFFDYTNSEFIGFFIFIILSLIIGVFLLSRFNEVDDKEVRYIFIISFLISSFSFGYTMIDTIAGWETIFYMIIICVSVDVFGLLFGKLYGKKKIAPKVSPNKTFEGAFGGIATASIFGTIWLSVFLGDSNFFVNIKMSNNPDLFILYAFLTSFSLSIVSFYGDLLFSYFKRQKNIKDYGNLIPGHGGVLDRMDSHIFVNLVMFIPLFCTFA